MPPKKDKKKIKAKKAKKMRLSVMEPSPKFATGFNRMIPGGVIGTGGGGGYVPSSFSVGGYASRQPPPATPIQTPDQFAIQRSLQATAEGVQNIIVEQTEVRKRKERSDKGMKREKSIPPDMPIQQTPMKVKFEMESPSVSMADADALTGGGASESPASNIRLTKKGTPDKRYRAGVIMFPPSSAPPIVKVESFPGGAPERQQGLSMSVPGRIRGQQFSSGTIALETGIGDADVAFTPPSSGLKDQGTQGDEM